MGNAKVSTKLAAVNAVTKVVNPYSFAVPGMSRNGKVGVGSSVGSGGGIKMGAGVGGVTGFLFEDFEDFGLFFGGGGGGP